MRVFAIGDLHLSFGEKVFLKDLQAADTYKPMEMFGPGWDRHFEKIAANWRRVVRDDDLVLLPGDLSWAMKPEEAVFDLDFVGQMPGTKVLIKGNHDYWWQTIAKVRRLLPPGVFALQNDHFAAGSLAVCGTRGWLCPGEEEAGDSANAHDLKIYLREIQRLELSLKSAARDGFEHILVMLHYPPVVNRAPDPGFMELMIRYGVKACLYGHLHSADAPPLLSEVQGIRFHLAACDYIGFSPVMICEGGKTS